MTEDKKVQETKKTVSVTILDTDYRNWLAELSSRFKKSQIKAAVRVNAEMLSFYWELGRDIISMKAESRWGEKFLTNLSRDLKELNPDASCFSQTNLLYMMNFYRLYHSYMEIAPQVVEQLQRDLFSVPWGHHRLIIDRCRDNPQKAMFFVKQTVEQGWSRAMLLNFLDTDLFERSGKALTNFERTLPEETSELAQELTKDPYNFSFTGITGRYNEKLLKDALLDNITNFLIELGTGFAYVGKEYRLQIGTKEKFVDLLFYNLNLSCYVVIEVKIGEFDFADVGQLGGYVVACNHLLKKEGRDNPTIGLLVCKQKDTLLAKYALESTTQPLGISEYELAQLYPENIAGTIPTIEEIEANLEEKLLKGQNREPV